jgi:DNA ligase-1
LTGPDHLKEYFDGIIAKGGEGVMLREPKSMYKAGRSHSLRKYKQFFDTEVKVVENNYPHGLNCQQYGCYKNNLLSFGRVNGKPLFVGLSDNYQEAKKVKQGAVITVKHLGSNVYGTLQFPKFFRERTDITWNDIINT